MRIGYGITAWSKGLQHQHLDGIGVYSRNLWQGLENLGCDVQGLRFGACATPPPELPRRHACIASNFNIQAARSAFTGLPFFGMADFERRIDLFHATDHHIPKLRRTPVIGTIMDAIPLVHPEWVSRNLRFFKNFAFRRSARWCERIITISEYSKQDIAEQFGLPTERIDAIPLGVNQAFFQRATEEETAHALRKHGVRRGSFVFVGTLQPRKNLRRIIEAHRRLPASTREEHPLLVIGRYGWGDDSLHKDLVALRRDGCGLWLDTVPDEALRPLLQSAIALVYPSLYEGFGLPVLEGFASRIPVISSRTSSIPEVAGDAALLIDPESVDDIAGAMERIAQDTALAQSLALRGLERARLFTWDRCAEQTLEVYRRVGG